MPITSDKRVYTSGKFALELDGTIGGWLQSVRGGDAQSDVVEEKLGPDSAIRKHLAGLKYSDIELACGTGMSTGFYAWLADSFDRKYSRKNGAIVSTDYDGKELSRLSFHNALISEIGFPALDAASKDAAKLTVKLSPEYTRSQKGAGAQVAVANGYKGQAAQKKWFPSNFRLKIDGLDCTRVNRIEALVVKQVLVDNLVGDTRDYEKLPAHLEIPDLVVTVAESHADAFVKWHEDFVINGNNAEDREKHGTLEFLAPNMQEVLFTLTFSQLGIFKLAAVPVEAGSENIRRLRASMYCEQMTFTAPGVGGAVVGASSSGSAGGTATSATTSSAPAAAPVVVGDQEPQLVVVSGSNGPVLAEDVPEQFTRIRRTV